MYLSVDEIVTRCELLAEQFPDDVALEELPEATPEARKMVLLRVKVGPKAPRHGLYIQANIHAREWGTSDIVMHFVEQLLLAHQAGINLVFGDKVFPLDDIRTALERIELFIVPCVNPDGRAFSMEQGFDEHGDFKFMWRHNRRDNGNPECFGVDLNRNFDWIWDFKTVAHPATWPENLPNCQGVINVTDDPCDPKQRYHGDKPFSEPETRNVKHVLDSHRHIRVFADVHGIRGLIMGPWADDEVQNVDPEQNFTNPAFDGLRGLGETLYTEGECAGTTLLPEGAAYREFMPAVDQARFGEFCTLQRDAIFLVRGTSYTAGASFVDMYGMSGNANDYAYSRHIADPALAKVDGYIYEFEIIGNASFQPLFEDPPGPNDMIHVIRNVSAGLAELLINVDRIPIVECTPASLDFGRVRVGTPKQRTITLANRGVRGFDVGPVALIGAAGPFSAGAPSQTHLEPGEQATIRVTAESTDTSRSIGRVAIEFAFPNETVCDVRIVKCAARGCTVPDDACVAPTFSGTSNSVVCFARALVYGLLIAVLALFVWRRSVRCKIKRLRFRIRRCRRGNDNPCRTL